MKNKILAIISGAVSAASLVFIYKKWFKNSKLEKNILNAEPVQFFSKKITSRDHYSNDRFINENPLSILFLVVFAAVLIFNGGLQKYMQFFQTSMIQTKYSTGPFDGTVSPVDKVPRWTALSTAERSYTYSQLPASKFMTLPRYNVSDFKKGLVWRRDNERERNTYITYPVPNLGNYKLDGTENSGSHTGVDIKVPIGTPIESISRGVVIKAENQPTGFGQHIVVMHKNVPNPKNPAEKTTLYSAYAHLSKLSVKVGQQVKKGQIIGYSGETGMATAPHLHFQIDTADAPFHPYWPITWTDVVNNRAGSFFEAVKRGINQNKAKQYTIHPMNFVAKNISYVSTTSRLIASAGTSDKEISRNSRTTKTVTNTIVPNNPTRVIRIPVRNNSKRRKFNFKRIAAPVTNNRIRVSIRRPTKITTTLHARAKKETVTQKTASVKTVNTTNSNPAKKVVPIKINKSGNNEVWFETDRSFVPGVTKNIKLFVNNKELIPNAGITISTTSRDFVKVVPTVAMSEAFKDGFLEIEITTRSNKPFKIIAMVEGESIKSSTLLARTFRDVPAIGKEKNATQYVKDHKIMKGYANGEFRPNNYLTRAEAAKVIVVANKFKLIPAKKDFNDIKSNDWFASYVSTAVDKGVISGYSGNLFKPVKNITKAEFLKMALIAKEINPADTSNDPYRDVPADSWYEKYFSFARNNGLISPDSRGFIHPNKIISRIDVAQILYKLSQLK